MDLSKISKTLTHPVRSLSLNVLTKNRTSIRCTCGHLCCRHSLPGQHFRSTPATATTLDTASSQSQYGCNVVTLLCRNTQAGNSTVVVQYINFIQLSSPQTASIGSGIQYRKIGCCTFRTLQATWPTDFGPYALTVERLSAELVDWKQLPLGVRRASKISQDICPLQSDNMEYFLYSCRNELVLCGHWGFQSMSSVRLLEGESQRFNELKSKHLDLWCIISCLKACKMGAPHHSEVAGHHARNGWTTWIKNIKKLTSFHFWSCCRD